MKQRLKAASLLACAAFLLTRSLSAANSGGLETVYIVPNPYIGLSLLQRYENTGGAGALYIREMSFLLNVSPSVELGVHVPYINRRVIGLPDADRVGDVTVKTNWTTDWFKDDLLVNFIAGFNFGSDKSFREPDVHPLESYGHEELHLGLLFMKNLDRWSIHLDLQYQFRAKNDDEDMVRGFTLNVFNGDAWKRWFGFNPNRKENFFYREKLKNDNLVYKLGVSHYYTYPIKMFTHLDFRHDFYSADEFGVKETVRAPGVFTSPLWWVIGAKWFFSDETANLQLYFNLPVNADARRFNRFGGGVGGYVEF